MKVSLSRLNLNIMDLLLAADFIEKESEEKAKRAALDKKVIGNVTNISQSRKVLGDVTNTSLSLPRFKNLLHGQLRRSVTPESFMTPKKRRRISFGNENVVLSPKTPKCNGIRVEQQTDSPPTPLSNLKLLTKIAATQRPLENVVSKRQLHNESIKSLFTQSPLRSESALSLFESNSTQSLIQNSENPIGSKNENDFKKFYSEINSFKGKNSPVPLKKHLSFGVENLNSKGDHFTEPSRKEKSLGVLVNRFLQHFPLEISCMETPRKILIDDVASILATERRRVYDIINILESLNMAERVHKNAYQWRGQQLLENTLSRLKKLAVQWGVQSQEGIALYYPDDLQNESPSSDSNGLLARKNKSLGVLCQKFMMLLLISPAPHIVHLDAAISFLLGHNIDSSTQNRTKGRRIYDIANVLMSLKLVKRLPQSKSFQYVGPGILASKEYEDIYGKLSKTRHSLLSPCEAVYSDEKSIGFGHSSFEISPNSSGTSFLKIREPLNKKVAPKAKRNCMAMSFPSSSVHKHKVLTARATTNEFLFKIPPVDAQLIKAKRLFEPRPAQIVTASKSKSLTYIHPNMKNLENNSTRVALTFDKSKLQKENIPPGSIDSSRFKRISSHKSVPMMFVGNGLRSLDNTQPFANQTVLPASCSTPALVGQHATPRRPAQSQNKISLPNINFNTLSKNHYKTVIGPVPAKAQTSNSGSGYRFVIKNNSNTTTSPVLRLCGNNQFMKVVRIAEDDKHN